MRSVPVLCSPDEARPEARLGQSPPRRLDPALPLVVELGEVGGEGRILKPASVEPAIAPGVRTAGGAGGRRRAVSARGLPRRPPRACLTSHRRAGPRGSRRLQRRAAGAPPTFSSSSVPRVLPFEGLHSAFPWRILADRLRPLPDAGRPEGSPRIAVARMPFPDCRCRRAGRSGPPPRRSAPAGNSLDSRLGATQRQTGRHRTAGSVSARVTALTVGSVSRRGE